jgi:hypothetical protein
MFISVANVGEARCIIFDMGDFEDEEQKLDGGTQL